MRVLSKVVLIISLLSITQTAFSAAMVSASNGKTYHIDIVLKTGSEFLSTLMAEDWWGDAALASELALATMSDFGLLNTANPESTNLYGASFATDSFVNNSTGDSFVGVNAYFPIATNGVARAAVNQEFGQWFATTSKGDIPPIPVPAAVWLFGSVLLGLAGFAKRKYD